MQHFAQITVSVLVIFSEQLLDRIIANKRSYIFLSYLLMNFVKYSFS